MKMNNEEKNLTQHQNRYKIVTQIKFIFRRIFFCCPTFFNPRNYYVDLGPIPLYKGTNSAFKKTLVLDIDKTLICSTLENVKDYDFTVEYKYRNIPFVYRVYKRPGLDQFLDYARENFDVVMFSASVKDHADPVIDKIAPWVAPSHRFYRNDCLYINSFFIKDLDRLNRPLNSIIMVDDSPASFNLHIPNGILISSFEGDKNDRELLYKIMPILQEAEHAQDVRDVIKKHK